MSPPLDPFLRQIIQAHVIRSCLIFILILFSILRPVQESSPFPSGFLARNSALHLFSTIHATIPAHLILLSFFMHSCQILEVKDFRELNRLSDILKFIQHLIYRCIHASQSAHNCQIIQYVTKYPNHLTSSASLKGSEQYLNGSC